MQSPENDVSTRTSVRNILQASGDLDETRAFTEIHLADGRILRLDTRTLGQSEVEQSEVPPGSFDNEVKLAIPLIEEQLTIGKRTVTTGKVILQKTIQEYEHRLNEPLALRTYDIERKILDEPIDTVPLVRQEGDTTIYPVVEEQLILTKQLVLKEEIHVTRRDGERIDTQVVTLHREHLDVQRESISDQGSKVVERVEQVRSKG